MMGFECHTSSAISRVMYNPILKHLGIEFRNGNIYVYEHVSMSTFAEFRDSKSRGRFFKRRLFGKYHIVHKDTGDNPSPSFREDCGSRRGNIYYFSDYEHLPRRSLVELLRAQRGGGFAAKHRAENNERVKSRLRKKD